jgi:small-conductance mechanosensitive channel
MNDGAGSLGLLRKLDSSDLLLMAGIVVGAWLAATAIRWALQHAAEFAPARLRLLVLRVVPLARLAIGIGAVALIVPVLVEPSFQNVVALVASTGLALAFAFKDYASSLAAGLVAVLENAYQPGDWIEIDGVYGEVKSIGARAVRLVTADDNEVTVPHYQFWSKKISNATSGGHGVLCVADFYLHPDHDGGEVLRRLQEIGVTNVGRRPESKVSVVAAENPWGTHYKLKAYVKDSREQFAFITDLTVRGKQALRVMDVPFALVPYSAKAVK